MAEFFAAWRDDARQWCQGRWFIWRAPILLYLAWAGWHGFSDSSYWTIFSGITLGIHELGHVIFSFVGQFIAVAGGSFAQVAAPVISAFLFLRQREYFGIAVAGGWLAGSLCELATYIGDAQAQVLPLVNIGGGDAEHDWTYLLTATGLLEYDARIAALTRLLGLLTLLASLTLGVWLCIIMARSKGEPEDF
jgi:hypothetical protein